MKSIAIGLKQRELSSVPEVLKRNIKDEDIRKIVMTDVGESDISPIEFHANIWEMPSGLIWNKSKIYVDIGLKVSFLYDKIKIYLPFAISENFGCLDLGDIIRDEKILGALFNTECVICSDVKSCFSKVELVGPTVKSNPNRASIFFLYTLGDQNIKISSEDPNKEGNQEDKKEDKKKDKKQKEGTWININIPDVPSCFKHEIQTAENNPIQPEGGEKPERQAEANYKNFIKSYYYIRFRILVDNSNEFVIRRDLSNDFLQSAFSQIELYDIRINDTRNLPQKIKEQFSPKGYSLATFRDAHIFYVSSSKAQVYNGSVIKTDSRIIEPSIWSSYEPDHNPTSIFIAHHWKFIKKRPETDDNERALNIKYSLDLFFTTVIPKLQLGTILVYVFVVILLGSLGSLLADNTYGFCNPSSMQAEDNDPENPISLNMRFWTLIGMGLYLFCFWIRDFRWKSEKYFVER